MDRRGQRFDLILCDMMMPLMTGMEFHTRLATTAPEQADRVVFMTGGAFTPRSREFLARLPNLRLEKPFDLARILSLVDAQLAEAARRPAAGLEREPEPGNPARRRSQGP